MLQNLNPFAQTTQLYQRISKEYSDDSDERSPTDTRPSTLPDEINSFIARSVRRQATRKHMCGYMLVCIVSLLIGSVAGPYYVRFSTEKDGFPGPFESSSHIVKDVVWERNETFEAPPSLYSEMAWMSLMPKGRGMVRYPKEDPLVKGVTVFHGIHCLYNLHTAFHANAYQLAKLQYELQNEAEDSEAEETHSAQHGKGSKHEGHGKEDEEEDEVEEEEEDEEEEEEESDDDNAKHPTGHKTTKESKESHHPKPHKKPAHHNNHPKYHRSLRPSNSPPASPIFPPRRRRQTTHIHNHNHGLPSSSSFSTPPQFKSNPYLDAKLADPEFRTFLKGEHLYHCFDYIRQSLMCSADSSLEPGEPNGKGEHGDGADVTGWGVKRVCKDFEGVRAWAEEWRLDEVDGLN